MKWETLRRQREAGCLVVELITPEKGALTRDWLSAELAEVCAEVEDDEDVRAVVLLYAGEVLGSLEPEADPDREAFAPSFVEAIAGLKVPVIAAVEGEVLGPALELALACDLRLAAPSARFGLPQLRAGLLPCDGGTQRLRQVVGLARALEFVLLGEPVDAEEALRIGLVHRVVKRGTPRSAALTLAGKIASRAPVAVSFAKEALHKGADLSLEQGLRMELDLYLLLFSTSDRTEGITASLEGRIPSFTGK